MRMRGAGKKPVMTHVTLRIPDEVVEFFKKQYPNGYTQGMRDVLAREALGGKR